MREFYSMQFEIILVQFCYDYYEEKTHIFEGFLPYEPFSIYDLYNEEQKKIANRNFFFSLKANRYHLKSICNDEFKQQIVVCKLNLVLLCIEFRGHSERSADDKKATACQWTLFM